MHDPLICRAIYHNARVVRHKVEALVDYELFSEIREIEWAISDPEEVQKLHELREQNKST